MTELNTISFGGLGDSFIVGLKLKQLHKELENITTINHLFVESNPKTCELIQEYFDNLKSNVLKIETETDIDYQKNFFLNKWKDRKIINTTWHGVYHFPGSDLIFLREDIALNPIKNKETQYDLCIQVSAGVDSTRSWNFDILKLRNLLENKGLKIALIGTNKKYYDLKDLDNYCCKTTLVESIKVVESSKVYMGLSGFHTYRSLSLGLPNIHAEESIEHNKHYIHPSWNKYRYGVKYRSLNEVMKGLKHWNLI